MDTNCPQCGLPARASLKVSFRKEWRDTPVMAQMYKCPHGCTQKVPYPGEPGDKHGYGDWDLEFVIVNGEKLVCRPTANEFA